MNQQESKGHRKIPPPLLCLRRLNFTQLWFRSLSLPPLSHTRTTLLGGDKINAELFEHSPFTGKHICYGRESVQVKSKDDFKERLLRSARRA